MERTFAFCGGYFTRCKEHQSFFGDTIIDEAMLLGIGVSAEDIDFNMSCLVVKEE